MLTLVTGAAGFIGSHLAGRLVGQGRAVIGIDNERSGDWTRVNRLVAQDRRDVCSLSVADWRDRLRGVGTVFHLAAEKYNSSRSSPQRVLDSNISATCRMIEGCGQAGVSRIVFTSSLYAYGNDGPNTMLETDVPTPSTVYGMSKIAGEDLLRWGGREYGIDWAVARLFFTYGRNQWADGGYKSVILKNFERIGSGLEPLIYGDGEQSLDYVHVNDVVDSLLRLEIAEQAGLIANVASGTGVSVNELTDLMLQVSESPLRPRYAESDWTAGTRRVGSAALLNAATGWSPQVSMAAGLADVWAWMQEER